MAYAIKLGTFYKHEESTKQPDTTLWDSYDVVFKEGTDIVSPVVTISGSLATISGYNYGYMLGRYYWIKGITALRNDYAVLELETDVLATYKTQIGSASLYVLRSASASDGDIVDRLYPTTEISYGYAEEDDFLPGSYSSGCYIVNCVGMTTTGGSTLWKLTPSQYRAVLYEMFNKIDGFQMADILDGIKKLLAGSPDKMLTSAMWMPSYNFSTSSHRFYVGPWDTTIDAALITDPIFEHTPIELTLPKHPQAATRGAFLNLAPFTTYTLNIPMFGAINLDTTAVKNATKIYLNIAIDALSGQGKCRVHGGTTPLLADLTAQIGVAVPLQGQSAGASVAGGITHTIASTITAAATGSGAALLGAVTAGIDTAISAVSGASFSTGSAGGALATLHNITLDATFLHIADEDNTHNGRPLCQLKQISTLSGYAIVENGDVDIPGTLPEQQRIRSFLESGFYYE